MYILGYGFDRNNSERLGLSRTLRLDMRNQITYKHVYFTNLGDVNRVNKAASKLFGAPANEFAPGRYIYRSDPFHAEKSVRNCYDAMALDFDEIEAD